MGDIKMEKKIYEELRNVSMKASEYFESYFDRERNERMTINAIIDTMTEEITPGEEISIYDKIKKLEGKIKRQSKAISKLETMNIKKFEKINEDLKESLGLIEKIYSFIEKNKDMKKEINEKLGMEVFESNTLWYAREVFEKLKELQNIE